jgi:putative N6-adenine-specific DNA methylase
LAIKVREMEENSKLPRVIKLQDPLTDATPATFFLVVNPGLEAQARNEAIRYLSASRIDTVNGGIQFDSTWGVVRLGQPKLRVASRVLVRIDQFGARDFQKLFRKVSNLPWENWLKPKVGLLVRAASHGSRLRIKSGIEESVVDAFKKSFKAPPPRPTQELLCLVRVEDDICTVSLDISGELLHKRGTHTDVGTAPLRETWAASIVDRALEIAGEDEKLQRAFDRGWQWIEPMAGTAVFLREALAMAKEAETSPAETITDSREVSKRVFAIDSCFKFERDENLLPLQVSAPVTTSRLFEKISVALIADRDEAQLERAKKALAGATGKLKVSYVIRGGGKAIGKAGPKPEPESPPNPNGEPRLVIVNPPWGQRLKGPDATDTTDGQTRLMAKIEQDWKPTLVAIVVPRIAGPAAKVPKNWVEHRALDFRAGGLPVSARFFTVPSRVKIASEGAS